MQKQQKSFFPFIFIVIGLVINPWTLGYLFSSITGDGIDFSNAILVYAFEFICLLTGIYLYTKKRLLIIPISILIYLAINYFIILVFDDAFVWSGLFSVCYLTTAAIIAVNPSVKFSLVILLSVFAALACYESYLCVFGYFGKNKRTFSGKLIIPNEHLGYTTLKNAKVTSSRYYGDLQIYKTTITTGATGLRITFPFKRTDDSKCVLCFGCSYTWGVGVNDEETYPYQIGLQTNGKHKVYNFACGAYGTHQMYSAIKNDIVKNVVDNEGFPVHIIYLALIDHAARAAGKKYWSASGPQYALSDNNKIIHMGRISDFHFFGNDKYKKIYPYICKSYIFKEFRQKFTQEVSINDIKLFIKLIDASRENARKIFPDCKFDVILWDRQLSKSGVGDYKFKNDVIKELNKIRIRPHLISDIIPNYISDEPKYRIDPIYESHPNPTAYKILAEYVAQNMLASE